MKYRLILMTILTAILLSTTAFAGELNITEGPDCEIQTVTFEVPADVSADWFPLEEVVAYLPMQVTRDTQAHKYVIESEPMKKTWPALRRQEIPECTLQWRTKDFKVVNDVLYCSPWFLASRLGGVGFVHESALWYCNTTLDLDGHIKSSLLELQVVAPEEYAFVTKYLTGGVKAAEKDIPDALAYTYPHAAKPVCYINDAKLYGATLASNIAHEAWHVHQARTGMKITEDGADAHELEILNTLLREQRIWNGTLSCYE